jgi:hypothetical protein
MNMSRGQQEALDQLRSIECAAGGTFLVTSVIEPTQADGGAIIEVAMSCSDLERAAGGIPLEDEERLDIFVPSNFPFEMPHVFVRHTRFAGHPHVQWKNSLCLYQAPSTEWVPNDGMFGFVARLHLWLQQGAIGQLDPVGAPLHPPVTYLMKGPTRTVTPRVDTPSIEVEPWFGTAHVRTHSDTRIDLVGWSPFLHADTPSNVAAAVLLPTPLPYEFPDKFIDLVAALEERGISQERLFLTLQAAAIHLERENPLYVILGTPMRGVSGGEKRQHLAAWYISPTFAWALRAELDRHSEHAELRRIAEDVRTMLLDWAKVAPVEWCVVREDRPEIMIRRDRGSPMQWFAGRSVAVWGCGALGGHAAEHLVRAGAGRVVLYDNGVVTPGVLLRQPYDDADIGASKASALAARLRRIRPDLDVVEHDGSILDDPLALDDWASAIDVVLDATASTAVMSRLELRRWEDKTNAPPIISMAITHDASCGMVAVAIPDHSGGPLDLCRRMKLAGPDGFVDEFWPSMARPASSRSPAARTRLSSDPRRT